MIELRWVTREVVWSVGYAPHGFPWGVGRERVLQCRQKLTRLDSDGHAVGAMWSEWRDVPTESQMTVSEPPRADNETQEAK